MNKYRRLMITTMMLGILFVVLQFFGFKEFWNQGMTLQASVSYSFLYVIVGLHAIHVFAGVVALMVMSLKSYSINKRTYSIVSVEMMNTYWHFVDVLWVYLVIFLMIIR